MTSYDDIIKKFPGIHSARKEFAKMENEILNTQKKIFQKITNPSMIDKWFPKRAEENIKILKEKLQSQLDNWRKIAEAPYPNVCKDNADLGDYKDMKREMIRNIQSEDGYYHIPDELCWDNFSKELRKDMEQFMKKHNIGIPMDIGLQLERTFMEPGTTWIHRTQIDRDSDYLLRNIGRDGLICTAEDLENTATPFKNYTTFITQAVNSYAYRQDSCKGFILIKTKGEPKITNQKLNPSQIVGYIGNDKGQLHDFISCEDMKEIIPEYDPDRKQNDEIDKEHNQEDVVGKMIDEIKEEIESEKNIDMKELFKENELEK